MEPEIADEYERLMEALEEAVEENPKSQRAEQLREQIVALLRKEFGNTATPTVSPRTMH